MFARKQIKHIHKRRRDLNKFKNSNLSNLNETCVLSYVHHNIIAAFVAWKRLFFVKSLIDKYARGKNVLDFGAGSGELGFLLSNSYGYSFIEELPSLASYVSDNVILSSKRTLENLKEDEFDVVACLDSLEHNISYQDIIDQLIVSLN